MKGDKAKFLANLAAIADGKAASMRDSVYDRTGIVVGRSTSLLAQGLHWYLRRCDVPDESVGLIWLYDLNEHLADAFVAFRTWDEFEGLRSKYREITGYEVPDFVDQHVGRLHRLAAVGNLCYVLAAISGDENARWLESKLDGYFHAQQQVVHQSWCKFVRVGYRELMPEMKRTGEWSRRGRFGSTTLDVGGFAGRTCFEFSRENGEKHITYVVDDSDMHGERSGSNDTDTPYAECVSMIEEVARLWSLEKLKVRR